MLKASDPDTVQFLMAPQLAKLKLKHGFFKKYGGVSGGDFASLNIKQGVGDSDENVQANLNLATEALKLNHQKLVFIKHSFGDNILIVDEHVDSGYHQNFDAVLTNRKDVVLAQGTADCGSLIIADKNKKFVGLIHGSWHTTKLDIVQKALSLAKRLYQIQAEDIIAAFGPMLCQNCFEFGDEAPQLFEPKHLKLKGERYHFNNQQKMIDQLLGAGIKAGNIWSSNTCTMESEDFFSYRKNKQLGKPAGRFLSTVSLG